MSRYYIVANSLGPLRARAVLCTRGGWFFTMAVTERRIFGSKSEVKRAQQWAKDSGVINAEIREEE